VLSSLWSGLDWGFQKEVEGRLGVA